MELPQRIRCEDVTEEITEKYHKLGYELVLQEYVMEHTLDDIREVDMPYALSFQCWSQTLEEEFFKVYRASFKDRPGFPGWSLEKWVDWISSDPDFRPDLTYLATVDNQAVGFIASAREVEFSDKHGYIIQVGVVPEWRRRGVAAALTNKSLEAWREKGRESVLLHVNQNNPGAIRLYESLGFTSIRLRGTFQKL